MAESKYLSYHADLKLHRPTLLLAYAGWGDGGEAATTAVKYLVGKLDAKPLATLDTEEFLDFTVVRPRVRQSGSGREIQWPNHEFFGINMPGCASDLVLGLGIEPHLRWKAYSRSVLELCDVLGIETAIMVGAYVADVIYTQPIDIHGSATDDPLGESLGLGPSNYEGPTGMMGVLSDLLGRAGIRCGTLWAALPHYISLCPNPRGSMALLRRVERATGFEFDFAGMLESIDHFDESVTEMVENDPELSAYVRELKRRAFSS